MVIMRSYEQGISLTENSHVKENNESRHTEDTPTGPTPTVVLETSSHAPDRRAISPATVRASCMATSEVPLGRADRGGSAEVKAGARLDDEAAAKWIEKCEATRVENEQRRQRRDGCLRDSAITGACAGTLGASLAFGIVRRPASTGPFRSLLGINVSGKAMGGAMQSFVVWMGFFMPFMFVSNVTRWRCQKQGLAAKGVSRS